ncbi:MAG: response regulator [Alphaproteobacteria bacterium]|nr:response regulator [Alphaproteobacteria bacterium]
MSETKKEDMRVLVVDDNLVVRKLIEVNLTNMGFKTIDVAANSQEAQDKIEAAPYNIVFLDWNMPGKSGYALMQEYREDRKYDTVAFVMVTAESQERYVREAVKAGATSYITKPISPAIFQDKVERVLEWIDNRVNQSSQSG